MAAPEIPVEVDDLTASWFSAVLERDVDRARVTDRHSGTTGRARVALTGAGVPESVFVKLPPFDERQRAFVDATGMGVTEARFYAEIAAEVPVRVPAVLHAAYEEHSGASRYVMVLEDLTASGCRFPTPRDGDIAERAHDIVVRLASLHGRYWETERFADGGDLAWVRPRGTGSGDGGASLVRIALDHLAERLPDGFRALAELYVARSRDVMDLYREGARTLIHGDPHLGNLFVDGSTTGFLDWAVLGCAPGVRDVAYVLCNSVPTEIRRAEERALIQTYCRHLADRGVSLDAAEAWEQYRLFSVYSWVSATCTAAMGAKWQPEHVGLGGTRRATIAASDLGALDLLHDRLG